MRNKKGVGDLLRDNLVFVIIVMVFLVGILLFVYQSRNGAGVWEDYYVKEIIKVIDLAEAGDEVWIEVDKAVEIALRNEVRKGDVFSLDNVENEVCVKLSRRKTCLNYFNEVDIVDFDLELVDYEYNGVYFKVVNVQGGNDDAG